MSVVVGEGARAAAERLGAVFGEGVVVDVESVLHQDADGRPGTFVEPVAIATLIVAVAQLAWMVFADLRVPGQPEPVPEVVARAVRVRLDHPTDLSAQDKALVIEVTVEEVVTRANPRN